MHPYHTPYTPAIPMQWVSKLNVHGRMVLPVVVRKEEVNGPVLSQYLHIVDKPESVDEYRLHSLFEVQYDPLAGSEGIESI